MSQALCLKLVFLLKHSTLPSVLLIRRDDDVIAKEIGDKEGGGSKSP